MVRTKLEQLKEEIQHYIGIPYWRNKLKEGKIIIEGFSGGKGTCQQIAVETIRLAKEQNIDLLKFTDKQIYNFQKKNKIGIDCSGLSYNLLDKYSEILGKSSIYYHVIGTESKKGVRRVSSDLLTSPINSIKINNIKDVKTGDLIRFNQGKHVMFVVEIKENQIFFVHSSEFTKTKGVHYGTVDIEITKDSYILKNWSDESSTGESYHSYYFPKKGDGIYRLKCLK
jgi:hypothetical protein